jgi:hypothetical protein
VTRTAPSESEVPFWAHRGVTKFPVALKLSGNSPLASVKVKVVVGVWSSRGECARGGVKELGMAISNNTVKTAAANDQNFTAAEQVSLMGRVGTDHVARSREGPGGRIVNLRADTRVSSGDQ